MVMENVHAKTRKEEQERAKITSHAHKTPFTHRRRYQEPIKAPNTNNPNPRTNSATSISRNREPLNSCQESNPDTAVKFTSHHFTLFTPVMHILPPISPFPSSPLSAKSTSTKGWCNLILYQLLHPPRVLNSVTSSHLPRPCLGLFSP